MNEMQTQMIDALRELTKEIRELREDFNPQIQNSKILELKAQDDRRQHEAIMKAHRERLERQRKKMETQKQECV